MGFEFGFPRDDDEILEIQWGVEITFVPDKEPIDYGLRLYALDSCTATPVVHEVVHGQNRYLTVYAKLAATTAASTGVNNSASAAVSLVIILISIFVPVLALGLGAWWFIEGRHKWR